MISYKNAIMNLVNVTGIESQFHIKSNAVESESCTCTGNQCWLDQYCDSHVWVTITGSHIVFHHLTF